MTEFHSYTSSVCYRRHLPLKGKAWFYVNSERLLLEERLRRMAVVRCSHDSGVNNILNGQSGTPVPTAEPLSNIVGNAFMHSAKKSHNGTDKSVPYGRALPLIQGLTKLFDLCRKAERIYTCVCKFGFSVQGG